MCQGQQQLTHRGGAEGKREGAGKWNEGTGCVLWWVVGVREGHMSSTSLVIPCHMLAQPHTRAKTDCEGSGFGRTLKIVATMSVTWNAVTAHHQNTQHHTEQCMATLCKQCKREGVDCKPVSWQDRRGRSKGNCEIFHKNSMWISLYSKGYGLKVCCFF